MEEGLGLLSDYLNMPKSCTVHLDCSLKLEPEAEVYNFSVHSHPREAFIYL